MNRRYFLSLLFLAPLPSRACMWDSDTLRDEATQKGDLYDFITGQFPHHGTAYYEARIKRLSALGNLDHAQRNDLAVAHTRLEHWDEAETLLKANLSAEPGDYYTLSNLGVLEKKRGRCEVAAEWIAKALAIKPEGHLGLGDWYFKNLQYRAAVAAAPDKAPAANFLGYEYAEAFQPRFTLEDQSPLGTKDEFTLRLQRMLENDQTFADGFLVTGDRLIVVGDLHLAFLCYKRAALLKHPNPREVTRRLDAMYGHFHQVGYPGGGPKAYAQWMTKVKQENDTAATRAFTAGADWLKSFQKTEARLVAKDGDENTTPEKVEAAMVSAGIKRSRP